MSMGLQWKAPAFCLREALRYAGVRGEDDEMAARMLDCFSEAEGVLDYRVCCREFPLKWEGDMCDLGFARVRSQSLARHLQGCDCLLVLGATVGIGLDRLILKYSRLAPSRALMLQALGAERIEALCDAFCEKTEAETAARGLHLTGRFSPGYGDVPLGLQRDIFRALQPERAIGLTLNDSLIMSPSKSVTALMGLSREKRDPPAQPCSRCGQRGCPYRKE